MYPLLNRTVFGICIKYTLGSVCIFSIYTPYECMAAAVYLHYTHGLFLFLLENNIPFKFSPLWEVSSF